MNNENSTAVEINFRERKNWEGPSGRHKDILNRHFGPLNFLLAVAGKTLTAMLSHITNSHLTSRPFIFSNAVRETENKGTTPL